MPFRVVLIGPSQVPISQHGRASRCYAALTPPGSSVDRGLAALAVTAGCNGGSGSVDMSCKEFMSLSSQDQQTAWVKAAKAAKRPQVATGGGLLNGMSVCQDRPEEKLSTVAGQVSPF